MWIVESSNPCNEKLQYIKRINAYVCISYDSRIQNICVYNTEF